MDTYRALEDAEISGALDIEGVLVVKADGHGNIEIQKVTEHSTKTGVKWGVVGGVVLGVLFPPSIIASAAALGVTGGVLGKLRQEHHKSQLGARSRARSRRTRRASSCWPRCRRCRMSRRRCPTPPR